MRSRHEPVYHLALAEDWEAARAAGGDYRVSTVGQSLADVGYIHCSFADQVQPVADRWYRGRTDVLLLTVDPDRLTARLVREPPEDDPAGEEFPHIHGPLDFDAVVAVTPVGPGLDGTLVIGDLPRPPDPDEPPPAG